MNITSGGVGLYVINSLPKKERPDIRKLSDSIVCELTIDRKRYFFVVLYRSLSDDQQEFDQFIENFELMLFRLSGEEPYAIIITGDFNSRFPQWWNGDNENDEGKQFEPLTPDLGLQQLKSGPTHKISESKSCIGMILINQPNLFIDTGIHSTLHEQCHHQIIHGKLNVKKLLHPLTFVNYGIMIRLMFSQSGKASKCSIGKILLRR